MRRERKVMEDPKKEWVYQVSSELTGFLTEVQLVKLIELERRYLPASTSHNDTQGHLSVGKLLLEVVYISTHTQGFS